jgi:hypothetical protein
MARTLNLGKESPEYMQKPLWSVMARSIVQGITSGRKAFRGGDYFQVGGEFLMEGEKCVWGHRMENTRDHAEIPEIRKVLGFDQVPEVGETKEETTERTPSPARNKRWSIAGGNLGRRLSNSRGRSWSRKRASWMGGETTERKVSP